MRGSLKSGLRGRGGEGAGGGVKHLGRRDSPFPGAPWLLTAASSFSAIAHAYRIYAR